VGGVVAGIPGAVVAVPTAAALVRAWPYLQGRETPPQAGPDAEESRDTARPGAGPQHP
jgi:predicted PurR-regulated permease PerM